MRRCIPGLLFFLLTTFFAKAEQPIFMISSADANPGQIVNIDFVVSDFTDIQSAQFSINWNPDVIAFRDLKNLNAQVPNLTVTSFNITPDFTNQGIITMAWFESGGNQATLPDGSLLFTLEFEVIGSPCQSSPIAITNNPSEIEISDDGVNNIGLVSNTGRVSVPGTGCIDISLIGNSVTGACGSEACVTFSVLNFSEVATMDFALVYDPAILLFDRFQNYAPLSGFGNGNTNMPTPGVLRVVWSSLNAENEFLPDGTTLFEICFDVVGSGGQSTTITFGAMPPVEIADVDNNVHDVSIQPATITSQCAIEGFAIIAPSVCTEPNQVVCIPISVNDFEDIISMQFSINWNPAVFVFDHIEGLNLPGLTADMFATPPDIAQGNVSVSWFDINPVTVPDLTSIFSLCLRPVGPTGSSTPITFSNNPAEIEIATEDSVLVHSLIHGSAEIQLDCEGCVISYTITPTPPNCPGQSTGSLNLNLDIGNCTCAPTFQWSTNPPVTTEDLIGVPAGIYSVTITVCEQIVVATGTIFDPPAMEASWSVTNPMPPNSSTGAINLTVTGGTAPYTFLWNTNPAAITEDIANLPAGVYSVTITDARGCIFIPDGIEVGADVSGAVTAVSCPGACNGAVSVTASFGVPPYTYSWNTVPPQTGPSIMGLCAGSYCVTVTDSGGATRNTCFMVTEPNPIVSAGITHDINVTCQGAIDLNFTGGASPVSYVWSNSMTTQDVINLCGGQHCVTITYGLGCTIDTCFTVNSGFVGLNLTVKPISCHNVCDGEITAIVSGAVQPVTYAWSNNATTATISNLCAGTYAVTVTDGAGNTATGMRTITAPQALNFAVLKTDPSDVGTADGSISIITSGGVAPYTFQWSGPVSGIFPSSLNNLPAGIYTITIRDNGGCEVIAFVELRSDDVGCYEGNKIITPNDDGKNDFFVITCVFDFDNHLRIFNRFGGLVFEADNYANNWTGVDGDNQLLPDGGYLWVLEIRNPVAPRILKGTVNVLRTAN